MTKGVIEKLLEVITFSDERLLLVNEAEEFACTRGGRWNYWDIHHVVDDSSFD